MKKSDLVKLVDEKPYSEHNLIKGLHGYVVSVCDDCADVLFFNPYKYGEFVFVNVKNKDLFIEKEHFPTDYEKKFLSKLDDILKNAKSKIEPNKFNEFDMVELLVEDEKYSKLGVHKGDKGCVVIGTEMKNKVMVDFSYIDKDNNYCGDCIVVDINDITIVPQAELK